MLVLQPFTTVSRRADGEWPQKALAESTYNKKDGTRARAMGPRTVWWALIKLCLVYTPQLGLAPARAHIQIAVGSGTIPQLRNASMCVCTGCVGKGA